MTHYTHRLSRVLIPIFMSTYFLSCNMNAEFIDLTNPPDFKKSQIKTIKDHQPANGQEHKDMVVVYLKNSDATNVKGFTPEIEVTSGDSVSVWCSMSDANGQSFCHFIADRQGTRDIRVSNIKTKKDLVEKVTFVGLANHASRAGLSAGSIEGGVSGTIRALDNQPAEYFVTGSLSWGSEIYSKTDAGHEVYSHIEGLVSKE